MATKSIPDMTAANPLDGTELLEIVQSISGVPRTRKATAQAIADLGGGDDSWKEAILCATNTTLDASAFGRTVGGVGSDDVVITMPDISTASSGTTIRVRNLIGASGKTLTVTAHSGDTIVDVVTSTPTDPVTVPTWNEMIFAAADFGSGMMWYAFKNSVDSAASSAVDMYTTGGLDGSHDGKVLYSVITGASATINLSNAKYGTILLNPQRTAITFTKSGGLTWYPADPGTTQSPAIYIGVGSGYAVVYPCDSQADHVANADSTSLATLAASIDAIRDALVAAGQMKTS